MKHAIHPLFATHKLNEKGVTRLGIIRSEFTRTLATIEALEITQGREYSRMKTFMEDACHAAVKAVSVDPKFQEAE
jgi:hypothetical protein